MIRYAAAIALLALAGCANGPRPVEVRTVEVYREVLRPCPVTAPDRPDTMTATDLPPDARDAARVLAARLLQWQAPGGWADQVAALLAICQRD